MTFKSLSIKKIGILLNSLIKLIKYYSYVNMLSINSIFKI